MSLQTEIAKTRIPKGTRARIEVIAAQADLTESAWLRRLILREVRTANVRPDARGMQVAEPVTHGGKRLRRVNVGLRKEDLLLLEARAQARGLRPSTYVSVLMRSHLRNLPPLPKEELLTLKRAVSELGALGRTFNQIARVANHSGRLGGPSRDDLRAILKVCEALRDHTKALLKANVVSWEVGHDKADA